MALVWIFLAYVASVIACLSLFVSPQNNVMTNLVAVVISFMLPAFLILFGVAMWIASYA